MKFNTDKLMLSIIMTTYNHESYIREALDSILMQKTKYRYEVLIGEDASPDLTRNILHEYEIRYPNVFTVFYREKNMGSYENWLDLAKRAKGKYIICLEGDDFWLDNDKIEKQIRFLEIHSEYIAVAHNCQVVDKDSNPNGENYPECKDEEYSLVHYANDILPGQTATFMYRNCYRERLLDTSLLKINLMPGDRRLYFTLICNGRIYCMQECKSAYRHIIDSGTSYSAMYENTQYDYMKAEKWYLSFIEYARRIKNEEALEISKLLYMKNMLAGLKRKQLSVKSFFMGLKKVDIRCKEFHIFSRSFVKYYVFGKPLWK